MADTTGEPLGVPFDQLVDKIKAQEYDLRDRQADFATRMMLHKSSVADHEKIVHPTLASPLHPGLVAVNELLQTLMTREADAFRATEAALFSRDLLVGRLRRAADAIALNPDAYTAEILAAELREIAELPLVTPKAMDMMRNATNPTRGSADGSNAGATQSVKMRMLLEPQMLATFERQYGGPLPDAIFSFKP